MLASGGQALYGLARTQAAGRPGAWMLPDGPWARTRCTLDSALNAPFASFLPSRTVVESPKTFRRPKKEAEDEGNGQTNKEK